MPTAATVTNRIMLPWPIETKKLHMKVIDAAPLIDLKVDLLGMDFEERYDIDPTMEKSMYRFGKPPSTVNIFVHIATLCSL